MVKVLSKGAAISALLLSTLLASGQEVGPDQYLESEEDINICSCFEYERGELSSPASIIKSFYNTDSVLTLEVFWMHPVVVAEKIQYDQGLIGIQNREYAITMVEEAMHNDSLLKVTYMIPELTYEEQAQPQMLLFGPLTLTYNRLMNLDKGKCGEYFIPLKGSSLIKED